MTRVSGIDIPDDPNAPCSHEGKQGFWVQGECVFIEGTAQKAIEKYRSKITNAQAAINHGRACGSLKEIQQRRVNDLLLEVACWPGNTNGYAETSRDGDALSVRGDRNAVIHQIRIILATGEWRVTRWDDADTKAQAMLRTR